MWPIPSFWTSNAKIASTKKDEDDPGQSNWDKPTRELMPWDTEIRGLEVQNVSQTVVELCEVNTVIASEKVPHISYGTRVGVEC